MRIQRVALVFDDRIRPDTTGIHCRRALAELVDVVHFRPEHRDQISSTGFDLYLSIDDDTDHRLPDSLRPRAYWAIDTHLDFPARFERAVSCDFVFAAQRDGAERLRQSGIDSALWLPLACDPEIHRPHDGAKQYGFAFVGNVVPGPRAELLELLKSRYPSHFIGNAYLHEMARIYSASRVVFNRSVRNDVNMRVFEAVACGSLLVTNDLAENGQDELFRDGVHLVTYRNADELLAKVAYYLKHEEEREAIAAAGRAEVLARHTYRHRMERLLAEVDARLARSGVPVAVVGPHRNNDPAPDAEGSTLALAPIIERASAAERPPPSVLASVIVPCCNQLEFTRQCFRALKQHTREPWELIVIDNGSADGTGAYLAGAQDLSALPVSVITNASNLGFPAAVNQGLKVARGEYLVLLNNDVVVTDTWLDQLIALAGADPTIGLTGPMSNYASPPQLVPDAPYIDMEQMHGFAARWRSEHRGQWFTAGKLSGFCLLMKRAVCETVGGLDEQFGIGFFDDDDLAERARRAGFQLAVAHDLFVHHFGSRTFAASGIDTERLLDENQRRFAAKWGFSNTEGRRVALSPWSGASNGALPARQVRISLTMIVRDEENNLPRALESAQGLFDEIVVVDTGSTDRTKEIAREFEARVFDFVWVADFAAARNAALARATGDYAFWMDADDVIEPAQREPVRRLLDGLRPGEHAAYVFRCACDPDSNGGGGETVVDHIRLFPLRDDVRWTYRVHEQIVPALKRAGIPYRWTHLVVRHTGYADPVLQAKKSERNELILLEDLEEQPNDPFLLFNLGNSALEREDWPQALELLGRSLALSAPTDSITRKLHALIARAHLMLGDTDRALQACADGLKLDPNDAELLFRRAVVHRKRGEPADAETCWRRVLTLRRPDEFASLDMGIYGHLTRRNLAILAEERGDPAEAARLWRGVLAECPRDLEGAWGVHRLAGPVEPEQVRWLIPGSRRRVVPVRGPGDFDPYLPAAFNWVRALRARVVVELGVRAGSSTRALLAGAAETGGEVWGVDLKKVHGIEDPHFHFVLADAADIADRWQAIDLLHIDTDPHTEQQTRLWLDLYAHRCRAIGLHDTHHPRFGVGAALRNFVGKGDWTVFEYWGNPSGWTLLTRPGERCPEDAAVNFGA
jgi:GT2 family glycosyltransferase/tetratricopeptide (TPR) repeat protein